MKYFCFNSTHGFHMREVDEQGNETLYNLLSDDGTHFVPLEEARVIEPSSETLGKTVERYCAIQLPDRAEGSR